MVGLVAVGYAIGPLVAARFLGHLPSLGLAAVSLVAVAVVYAPVAGWQHPDRFPPGTVVASVLLLGLVCTALAFVAFFELIKEIGSTRSTIITYLNPAVAVILGVVLLGERFTPGTGIGFGLILAGCWLSTAPRGPVPVGPGPTGAGAAGRPEGVAYSAGDRLAKEL
jgi:drug/metabolite transporter (DMT)-like permease